MVLPYCHAGDHGVWSVTHSVLLVDSFYYIEFGSSCACAACLEACSVDDLLLVLARLSACLVGWTELSGWSGQNFLTGSFGLNCGSLRRFIFLYYLRLVEPDP